MKRHFPRNIGRSYFQHLFRSKLGGVNLLSLCVASFFISVRHVLGMSAQEQMIHSETRWIVAPMAHVQSIWNWTRNQSPCNAMYEPLFSLEVKYTISVGIESCNPLSTGRSKASFDISKFTFNPRFNVGFRSGKSIHNQTATRFCVPTLEFVIVDGPFVSAVTTAQTFSTMATVRVDSGFGWTDHDQSCKSSAGRNRFVSRHDIGSFNVLFSDGRTASTGGHCDSALSQEGVN